MSDGDSMRLMRTCPVPAAGRRSPCTWRSVTGNKASAWRSMMPNGAVANLAIGGAAPVVTCSGKAPALASSRPEASFKSLGSAMVKRAFSGSGVAKRTCVTSVDLSSLSNTGASAAPRAGCSSTCCACARATGSEKLTVSGLIGRQGAAARSRSQLNSAVKALRTRNPKRCGARVSTCGLTCAAMPAPHTRRIGVSPGSGRWQASTSKLGAALSSFKVLMRSARTAPATTRTAMRSPMPSTSHQAWRATLPSTAGPVRCNTKCWSSSMSLPSPGCTRSTAGPPVLKLNSVRPLTAGAGVVAAAEAAAAATPGLQSARSFTVQRVPGGSGSRKSNSQLRPSAQRPLPVTALPWQATTTGSG